MNEEERIIEVTGHKVRAPITWFKDPTRHLLKIKAVNALDSGDADAQRSTPEESPPEETDSQPRAD
ncbi:MAG: hypothetical protein OXN88_10305 [Chloroflexota bacterium]|nr:hypothetical protein [Chloroflexota bacterium]